MGILEKALKSTGEPIFYVEYTIEPGEEIHMIKVFAGTAGGAKRVAGRILEGEYGTRYKIVSVSCV